MSRRRASDGDVYAEARTGELGDPLLPRWFVLLAVVSVPVAIGVAVAAFAVFAPGAVDVVERRPPPGAGLTTAVGDLVVGDRTPVPVEGLCPLLDGVQAAGTDADRAAFERAATALCDVAHDEDAARRLQAFARAGGVLRFAQFAATGVDSTADLAASPPAIYVNARFARTDPRAIAPLVVHDTTFLEEDPALAPSALAARTAEAEVCDDLFGDGRAPRGCDDARGVLELDDPISALRAAGFG